MVKLILCKAVQSNNDFEVNLTKWFDVKDVNHIIDYDADVYGCDRDGTVKLLAKFRKNVFNSDQVKLGWECFRDAAIMTRTRAAAAGPPDLSGAYWSNQKIGQIKGNGVILVRPDGTLSKFRAVNPVSSGTLGFFETTPRLHTPCRLTAYTRKHLKKFIKGASFISAIDEQFKKLIPENHTKQLNEARKRPEYQIADTAFSTVTVNMNFRTALHKDAGDYEDGFGNLTVIEYGKYRGGETLFPRYRIGFDVRTGDFLAMDVHEYHCNAKIWTTKEDDAYNETLPDIRTLKSTSQRLGTAGAEERYGRLTFVCYLRKKLIKCDPTLTKKYYEKIGFNDGELLKHTGAHADEHAESHKTDGAEIRSASAKT